MARSVRMLAAVVALLVAAPVLSASAATGPRLPAKFLPSQAQVVKAFPELRGTGRYVGEVPWNEIMLPTAEDCITFDHLATSFRSVSAGYRKGGSEVLVEIYRFRNPARPGRIVGKVQKFQKACEGHYVDDPEFPDMVVDRDTLPVPRIGGATVAYRTAVTGMDDITFLDVWFRKGRYVVRVEANSTTAVPDVGGAVAVAREVARRLR